MKPYETWKTGDIVNVALPPLHNVEHGYVIYSGTEDQVENKVRDWKELYDDFSEAL